MRNHGDVTLLNGFAFHGYRSFTSDLMTELLPLRKLNLIAGQNNTGKSNILRVIANTYGTEKGSPEPLDRPLGDSEYSYERYEFFTIDEILSWDPIASSSPEVLQSIRRFLGHPKLLGASWGTQDHGMWVRVMRGGKVDAHALGVLGEDVGNLPGARALSTQLTRESSSSPGQNVAGVLRALFASKPLPPSAFTVGGVRAISSDSSGDFDLNGSSIKRRLLELQNPSTDRLDDKKRFAVLQDFVRAVLDDESITIDIPHDLATIHITQSGRTLPIENMGTGVHEVVILAAAATITQDSIICMEEPEVHLHPVLQRKLLRYLESHTSNQYFIATHSAHMLDSEIGSIFHVSLADGRSAVRFAGAARDRAAVCADLGYRPSDLVQTNAVLWVEGPSDRIYLKSWIERIAPKEFIEGTHYSVMFYGGALLSALSPLDAEEVEEFISLRNLNRYMMVLIDSDKKSRGAVLSPTKRRVIEGLGGDPSTGFAWVTAGYTIENYVPEGTLMQAIYAAHPSTNNAQFPAQDRWKNPLSAERLSFKQPSKVAISKCAIGLWEDEWPLDLKKKTSEVVDLIRRANSHT